MNFGQIVTAISGNQDVGLFSANVDPKPWIVRAYAKVWGAAEWPFKLSILDMDITPGDYAITLPDGFFKPVAVFDDFDREVQFMASIEWFRRFGAGNTDDIRGHPDFYAFFNRQILVGPRSDATYDYRVVYERELSVLNADEVTWTPGSWDMTTLTQLPVWDEAYHWLLVNGAAEIGYTLLGSPLATMHGQQFTAGIQEMISFYAPYSGRENVQFLRDTLR